MTTKISPSKQGRLLSLYFEGYNQVQIGQKLNIDQSTVSIYISKFGLQSREKGLQAASQEVGIMDVISALHSLAAELQSNKLSVEEAKLGLKTRLKLEAYGIVEEHYTELIQAAVKMKDEGFLYSALKLTSLEKATGMGYAEITAKYESVISEMEQKSKQLDDLKAAMAQQQSALKSIEDKTKTCIKKYTDYMHQFDMNMDRLKVVEKISALLKKAGVTDSKLEIYIQRQQGLDNSGIDVELFSKIASNVAVATSADRGKRLLDMLAEYGNLQAVIDKLSANKRNLEKQLLGFSNNVEEKNQLVKEIAKLVAERSTLTVIIKDLEGKSKIKDQLEYKIKSLENTRQAAEMDIKALQNQKLALEEEVVATKSQLTELQPRKTEHEGGW